MKGTIFILFFVVWIFQLSNSAVFTEKEKENVENIIRVAVGCKNLTGLNVAASKNGEKYSSGFGRSDLEDQTNVTKETMMNIGSVTKTLTSLVLVKLISEAKRKNDSSVSWNTKIQDVFTDNYQLNDECMSSMVNLGDMMSHRTGLSSADLFLQAGVARHTTRGDIIENLKYLESVTPFRDAWSYCNICYILVGYLAERWSKKSWEELMRQELFIPLNMTSSTFLTNRTLEQLATPYTKNRDKETVKSDLRLYDILDQFGPAGSVCSSAEDMSNLLNLLTSNNYQDELNIDEKVFKSMFQPKSILSSGVSEMYSMRSPPFPVPLETREYGMAWFLSRYRGADYYFHSGNLYGYTSLLGFIPSKNVSVFLNSNGGPSASKDLAPIMYHMFDVINGDEAWLNETTVCSFPSPWKEEETNSTTQQNSTQENIDNTSRFVGRYSNPLYGQFMVTEAEGVLTVKYGRLLRGKLSYFADTTFNLTVFEPLSEVFRDVDFTVSFGNFLKDQFMNVTINKNPSFDRVPGEVSKANVHKMHFTLLTCTFLHFALVWLIGYLCDGIQVNYS